VATLVTDVERIPTYVRGLDAKLQGGIPRGSIVLVSGHAGSMKSSLIYALMWQANTQHRLKSVYVTMEQTKDHMLQHMALMGMKERPPEEMLLIDLTRLRRDAEKAGRKEVDWTEAILQSVKKYQATYGCDIFGLDSLQALYALQNFDNPRNDLFKFFDALRETKLTTFLISEMPTDRFVFGQFGIEDFLADGIMHLKVEHGKRSSNLFVGVLKLRKTNHQKGYFPLLYEKNAFEIVVD
jgi:KaiC/GvpD/RAD55 family RecA-like ATPase